jgi:hypothetical protein
MVGDSIENIYPIINMEARHFGRRTHVFAGHNAGAGPQYPISLSFS